MSTHAVEPLTQARATSRPRIAGWLGVAGGALGVLAGLFELTLGEQIRSWVGDKNDTTRLGLVTTGLAAIAVLAAVVLLNGRATSPPRRLSVAAGLLVPGAVCFTTVGRLWYAPGVLLLAAALLVGADLRTEGRALAASLELHGTAVLTVVLGALYVFLGATALGVPGILGIAGGALAIALVMARDRIPPSPAAALLVVAAVPFAALTWWSIASPLIGALLIAIGIPALRRR